MPKVKLIPQQSSSPSVGIGGPLVAECTADVDQDSSALFGIMISNRQGTSINVNSLGRSPNPRSLTVAYAGDFKKDFLMDEDVE
jgi:hypothetical protein